MIHVVDTGIPQLNTEMIEIVDEEENIFTGGGVKVIKKVLQHCNPDGCKPGVIKKHVR